MAFTVPPTNALAGELIAPTVAVAIQDAGGTTVSSATNSVTIGLAANPAGGTLSGATTANAINGVASFPDLTIEKPGSGYTLVASSAPLAAATSAPFSVVAGPVSTVWVNPGGAVLTFPSGSLSTQLQATALDSRGNAVATAVAWSTSDPNVATVDMDGLVVGNQVGVATISASAGGHIGTAIIAVSCLPPRCSLPFSMAFGQQPTTTQAGSALAPPVQVMLQNNGSTGAAGVLSIVLGYNPGNTVLSGNNEVPVNGFPTTTWSNLSVARPGAGFTLVAIVRSGTGVWGISSAAFNITP